MFSFEYCKIFKDSFFIEQFCWLLLKIVQNWSIPRDIVCFRDKSWLTLTMLNNNSCELYSKIFSQTLIKVIKIHHFGVTIFQAPCRIKWVPESDIIYKISSYDKSLSVLCVLLNLWQQPKGVQYLIFLWKEVSGFQLLILIPSKS